MTNTPALSEQAAHIAAEAEELARQAEALALAAHTWAPPSGHDDFLIMGLIVFVLACFVGYHVVWRVTPALHSPLMGMTNAISSVIIVGALLAAGLSEFSAASFLGFVAVVLAAINIFGGFIVTRRMLAMWEKLRAPRPRLGQWNITRLRIFGSVARGTAGPDSDVDLIADFSVTPGLNFFSAQAWIEENFERPVDLHTVGGWQPQIGPIILNEAEDV
jgi:H+-translocating NAD(P) transhydrogenase subunit alpha